MLTGVQVDTPFLFSRGCPADNTDSEGLSLPGVVTGVGPVVAVSDFTVRRLGRIAPRSMVFRITSSFPEVSAGSAFPLSCSRRADTVVSRFFSSGSPEFPDFETDDSACPEGAACTASRAAIRDATALPTEFSSRDPDFGFSALPETALGGSR